ncbi:hypothetical protein HXX25_00410 [Hyphobacterium sp. CCMP332]|uniref:hypothetical protein n=1 Tax=Hyphobacterium sp. CCMP332 TaxID=2749086 RepID=UPI00164F50E2|nr:hypothetical protein [Hyphobacterium sp. CCMP332]QNL17927.1 hypothetical protein HXX25_00410 [Hyphobacterium sp. CCMP332]
MILARLSRAVREQNWFAVALEFVIVIAGVVIGFQITAWNADRAAAERADILTARLIADLRAEQWRVEGNTIYYAQVSDNAQRTIDALEGRREVEDETLVIEAFRATQIFSFPVIRTTYEELVSTGTIDLISDEALMTAAVEYYESGQDDLSFQDRDRTYRHAFFRLSERALYDALADTCAEPRTLEIGDYHALSGILDFPCDIVGHDAAIAAMAERLRADDDLLPLLRQRAVETSIESNSQIYWQLMFERILPPREAG